MQSNNFLNPSFNLDFKNLYQLEGLKKIQDHFEEFLKKSDLNIYQQFLINKNKDSQLLVEVAKYLEKFIVNLFLIENENRKLSQYYQGLELISQIRRDYVIREISKKYPNYQFDQTSFNPQEILKNLALSNLNLEDLELELARMISKENHLELIEKYCLWALFSKDGKQFHRNGSLFIIHQKIDKENLLKNPDLQDQKNLRGFDLIDEGYTRQRIHLESRYCLYCHKQNKDSCRTGICDKETNKIKIDELGVELSGCPLDQKISEMNLLQSQGFIIGALAVAIIDNPMIAGTGSRICNDCMKSCIFQKQESVDIPQIETAILKDILSLPYGFEIYSLLTRFNPLNLSQPLIKPASGKKILVCGLGPSGYTLAHYLLNLGHEVVAIDGLKIEPLNQQISGKDLENNIYDFLPIKFFEDIVEPLSNRTILGFGGVAEYGITARWDKNFLKIIFLLLQRRSNFKVYGGIRFGSAITPQLAFEKYGFDHIALCIGAGRSEFLKIKNNFVKGVYLGSDFLMNLQLSGAFKKDSLANLQIRSPILVIGGGLTAIDCATEIKAYYSMMLLKFSEKVKKIGWQNLSENLNQEELIIAKEFLDDVEKLKENKGDIASVKILYRKEIKKSPAYRINHSEVQKALDQGVEIIENCEVAEIIVDNFQAIKAIRTKSGEIIPCRCLIYGIGTVPNLSIINEDQLDLTNDGKYFLSLADNVLRHNLAENNSKNSLLNNEIIANFKNFKFINSIDKNHHKAISFFGDLHRNFEGSVVKAMASAKKGVGEIQQVINYAKSTKSIRNIDLDFMVKIIKINRLSNHVVEVIINAPLLAWQTQIGQIFRLQNYEKYAKKIADQKLLMEGIAITALSVNKDSGIITGIVVETGGSSSLIENFKENEPCIFMGPSGKPTDIASNETVIMIGGGRGNQPLTALSEAFSANGCKVIFFAGYRQSEFIVNLNRMKKSCAELIIAIEEKIPEQEISKNNFFQGNIIEAIKNYFTKNPLKIDRVFAIGNDNLMHEIARLRHDKIIQSFALAKYAIASLNAPMQCMMKGVCGKCLQKKINKNGEEEYFYSCANQDQLMDELDFEHLHNRCEQNSLLEKTSKSWLQFLKKSEDEKSQNILKN